MRLINFKISERHRHRYEFNNKYKDAFVKAGLVATGINEEIDLVEIIEIQNTHGLLEFNFIEYKSTVLNPHPLYRFY